MSVFVALHTEEGVIVRTDIDSGYYPADGGTIDNCIVNRIYDLGDLTLAEFVETHVWEESAGEWIAVPPKPNAYAFWDRTMSPAGWNWSVEYILNEIRQHRAMKITLTDWTQLPDAPLTAEQKAAWSEYRQQLRDITETLDMTVVKTSSDVVWPEPPTF